MSDDFKYYVKKYWWRVLIAVVVTIISFITTSEYQVGENGKTVVFLLICGILIAFYCFVTKRIFEKPGASEKRQNAGCLVTIASIILGIVLFNIAIDNDTLMYIITIIGYFTISMVLLCSEDW